MGGYSKNIAVLKGVRGGFSADGRAVSGLVKAEKFSTYLRVEATLINFAPLSSGRYVLAISDGAAEEVFETEGFEGDSEADTSYGFAAVVCFCGGGEVKRVAQAVCGDLAYAADFAERAVKMAENKQENKDNAENISCGYNDDAIAEDNYFEYAQQNKADEDGESVRAGEEGSGEKGRDIAENDEDSSVCQEQEEVTAAETADDETDNVTQSSGGNKTAAAEQDGEKEDIIYGGLARDLGFYQKMKSEIDKLFTTYPHEEELERMVEGSEWVKITYGGGKYYVFGIIKMDGKPRYLCYGVPALNDKNPPASLNGMASYIPVQGGGYWVMYQDALTGASIPIAGD